MTTKEEKDKSFYIDVCAKLRQIRKKADLIKKTTELTESISDKSQKKEEDE